MNILDTTIRDGSYAVDFKFSVKDVRNLVWRANKLGIKYIEIGHGQGLNASSREHGLALHTDAEYIEAGNDVRGDCMLGAFCIPGIARMEDLVSAKKLGLSFIRVGVNAGQYEEAKPYIFKAVELGYEVMVNFMKSYVVNAVEFARQAAMAWSDGASVVYIVDSAGCMDPRLISEYLEAIRTVSDVKIGFHGHNNMGLAVSNTVFCAQKGVEFLDCSFQGLGRSCGNASLEQVIMNLTKLGIVKNFDIPCVLEFGYSGLRNITKETLVHPLHYMCGYAGFHSGYLKEIYQCSNEKQVDPMRLILAYSQFDKRDMNYEKLCEVADRLPRDTDENPYNFGEFFSVKYSE